MERYANIGLELCCAGYAGVAVGQKLGVSAPFADPRKPSPDANVFWSPDVVSFALKGKASRQHATEVNAVSLPGVKQLIVDAKGLQHLRFIANQRTISLVLEGVSVAVSPAHVVFYVEGFEHLQEARDAFATLNDFLRDTKRQENPSWTAASLSLRDALVALDGDSAGASYRDIAKVIFGVERVEKAWRSESTALKDRIRRALRRGLDISAGGYRDFL